MEKWKKKYCIAITFCKIIPWILTPMQVQVHWGFSALLQLQVN